MSSNRSTSHLDANLVDTQCIPVKRLAFNRLTGAHNAVAPVKRFIKGPIPLDWISWANALPGKAGAVGLALWFLVGLKASRAVKLTGEIQQIASCERKAVYAALASLEAARLISVERRPGARPTVTINHGNDGDRHQQA